MRAQLLLTMTQLNMKYKQRTTRKESKENLMSICMPPNYLALESKEGKEENTQTDIVYIHSCILKKPWLCKT